MNRVEIMGRPQSGVRSDCPGRAPPARYPDDPTPETEEAWACQQEARGIIVTLSTCFDGKNNLIFVRGELPDWVVRNSRDFGYILQRVLAITDGECLLCKLDDPQRAGWAIFSNFDDGSVGKRELFGNDLLAVTSALDSPLAFSGGSSARRKWIDLVGWS